jgi:hypothetical protein
VTATVVVLAVIAAFNSQADEKASADRAVSPLVHELKDNVPMRLAGARFSEARAHNLIVKFETLGKEPVARILEFPPGNFTVHEQTLRTVVMSCVDVKSPAGAGGWHAAHTEAIFSLSKEEPGGAWRYRQFEQCYLVSLRLKRE